VRGSNPTPGRGRIGWKPSPKPAKTDLYFQRHSRKAEIPSRALSIWPKRLKWHKIRINIDSSCVFTHVMLRIPLIILLAWLSAATAVQAQGFKFSNV
jgi:hypothetical protein